MISHKQESRGGAVSGLANLEAQQYQQGLTLCRP